MKGYLLHWIGDHLQSKTLCTSKHHANNIWRDLLLRHDPFLRQFYGNP